MHKIMTSCVPPNLSANFPINSARNSGSVCIPIPRIDLFKTSLLYSGGTLWNTLPKYLKEKQKPEAFKRNYYMYLMQTL